MKYYIFLVAILTTGIAFAQQKSRNITTNAARDLIPEGVAVHNGTIYISSINRHLIIAVDAYGKSKNFIAPGQDSFLEGLGMKVDTARGLLWALSVKKDSNTYISQVHAFELITGKTKYRHKLQDTIQHLFNDLVIDAKGTIYITDTYHSAVYTFDPAADKLELFLKSPYLLYPNGLTFGKNNRLYIATYENGLMQLDVNTKNVKPLHGYKDSTLAHGLDGLVYWNNTLIGVYNNSDSRSGNAVVQYSLDATGEKIIQEKVLDKGNPVFYEPTTAALSGNMLYLLANSHLALYNKNKTSTKGIEAKLLPPVVVVYQLFEKM
jgi:outer membrane protein assembly factor BamB